MDHGKFNIKLKTFNYYEEKYNQKLLESNCLLQPLNVLCGGCTHHHYPRVPLNIQASRQQTLHQ